MATNSDSNSDETVALLRQLLAVELYRAGLSQAEIRERLGVGMNVVSQMLKGVSREILVRTQPGD